MCENREQLVQGLGQNKICSMCGGQGTIFEIARPVIRWRDTRVVPIIRYEKKCPCCYGNHLCPWCGNRLERNFDGLAYCEVCLWTEARLGESPVADTTVEVEKFLQIYLRGE
jgi:hypothetical protein